VRVVEEGTGSATVRLYDYEPPPDHLCEDVARGLASEPRKLPPKYFYDERGARLFERITELDAYYPTRTEIAILREHGERIGEKLGSGIRLVEFGSGSGEKTWLLLRRLREPSAYVPVDISRAQLVEFALSVAEAFPGIEVAPVCADYTRPFQLPAPEAPSSGCVAFFPGSTLGNFEPAEAESFLRLIRGIVGPDGRLLIGIDLLKDPSLIERAYNDPEGVTAEFNLNLLERINRECGADFDVSAFRHHAFFDAEANRVEMRLVSLREQTVDLPAPAPDEADLRVRFGAGDWITTEYSHKYDRESFAALAERAGWVISDGWTDDRDWFAVFLLEGADGAGR
jgi:dimethylhistidine N-methyltransferase